MTIIENETQYNWAVERVEKLIPLVKEDTPETDKNFIELNHIEGYGFQYKNSTYYGLYYKDKLVKILTLLI